MVAHDNRNMQHFENKALFFNKLHVLLVVFLIIDNNKS
jgi:hypothetical protein